jgi:hypothetical protein
VIAYPKDLIERHCLEGEFQAIATNEPVTHVGTRGSSASTDRQIITDARAIDGTMAAAS